jgi:hypothetical protein
MAFRRPAQVTGDGCEPVIGKVCPRGQDVAERRHGRNERATRATAGLGSMRMQSRPAAHGADRTRNLHEGLRT